MLPEGCCGVSPSQMWMDSVGVSLGAASSLLHIAASAWVQGTTIGGVGSTAHTGTAASTLTSTGNTWLPAAELLAVTPAAGRRIARSTVSTLRICGSQHGSISVPSSMTLVALLNCTLSSNEAYSSATTSLTFASGSLMVWQCDGARVPGRVWRVGGGGVGVHIEPRFLRNSCPMSISAIFLRTENMFFGHSIGFKLPGRRPLFAAPVP